MSARFNTLHSIPRPQPAVRSPQSPARRCCSPSPADVPIWQLDNLFLKRQRQSLRRHSNVSAVFLFSVIVLNQSQKSVIMTALLIVTAQSANCAEQKTVWQRTRHVHSYQRLMILNLHRHLQLIP